QKAAAAQPVPSPIPAAVTTLPPLPTLRKEPGADPIGDLLDQALVETDVIRREDVANAVTVTETNAPGATAHRPPPPTLRFGAGAAAGVGTKTETELRVPDAELMPRPPVREREPGPAMVGPEAVVVLSCEPFAPLPLELHRPVCIGRVPGNDFVLPNPQV